MNKNTVLTLVQAALERNEPVQLEDSCKTIEAWDSLAQLQILLRIDQATGGRASAIPELAGALSVAALIEVLGANGLLDA